MGQPPKKKGEKGRHSTPEPAEGMRADGTSPQPCEWALCQPGKTERADQGMIAPRPGRAEPHPGCEGSAEWSDASKGLAGAAGLQQDWLRGPMQLGLLQGLRNKEKPPRRSFGPNLTLRQRTRLLGQKIRRVVLPQTGSSIAAARARTPLPT